MRFRSPLRKRSNSDTKPIRTSNGCRSIAARFRKISSQQVVRWLAAVEAANDAFSNYRCLRRIVGLRHARSEIRQFFAGKFSFRIELIGKSNNTQLIFRIETLDLFDDLFSSHDLMLPHTAATFNLAVAPKKVSAVPSGTWARALAPS